MVSRPLRAAAVGTVLWTPTGCDGGSKPCELFDVVPQVAVTWQVDGLPYSEDCAYRPGVWPSIAEAVRRYGGQPRVLRLPEGYDERQAQIRLELSGGQDANRPELEI
ncbi:hypothetical protein ABZ153_40700 [Streptomyces sp. NPDC006290]|uniref:hypothetical protein n=1 Tax=Streptomyces sp. NPDC006290 TaxID=3156745 RepID=UPI0033A081D5